MLNRGISLVLKEGNFVITTICSRYIYVIFNTLVFSAHISFVHSTFSENGGDSFTLLSVLLLLFFLSEFVLL